MVGVLIGFAIIGTIIAIGYAIGRIGLLGSAPQFALSRLVFFVLTPSLLFTVLSEADLRVTFSPLILVSAAAATVCFVLYAVVARVFWRRRVPETVIGSLGAGYVNANNIGIPVSLYVLGNAALSAPIVLFQLVIVTPIVMAILDASTLGRTSLRRILKQPFTNPLIVASALGVLVAVTRVDLPTIVTEPFRLIGGAAVPVVLLSFGMSLSGARILEAGAGRRDVLLAGALKLAVMPLAAWAIGRFVFGLEGHDLFVAVVLAALPSAQNVFNYAQRYERGVILARDTVLITTVLSIPVLVVVAALLA